MHKPKILFFDIDGHPHRHAEKVHHTAYALHPAQIAGKRHPAGPLPPAFAHDGAAGRVPRCAVRCVYYLQRLLLL